MRSILDGNRNSKINNKGWRELNRVYLHKDIINLYGEDNIVYISIYDRDNNNYYNEIVKAICDNREDNKKLVIDMVTNMLKKVV